MKLSIKSVNGKHIATKRPKLALWVVSNCYYTKGAAERLKYVKQLKKDGLQIDLGGKCFPNGVKNWKVQDYKFYFAFENSIHCKDYITEKFFVTSLQNGVVPVVFGPRKSDYERIAPPNSFIYAQDYTNKELIALLNYLNYNDEAYMKYFEWREIEVESLYERYRARGFCQLCRILHGINYDYIFNRNYVNKYRDLELFTNKPQTRIISSITRWLYDDENRVCTQQTFTTFSWIMFLLVGNRTLINICIIITLFIVYLRFRYRSK